MPNTTQNYYQAERQQRERLRSIERLLRTVTTEVHRMEFQPFSIAIALDASAFANTLAEELGDVLKECREYRNLQLELDGVKPLEPEQTTFAGVA